MQRSFLYWREANVVKQRVSSAIAALWRRKDLRAMLILSLAVVLIFPAVEQMILYPRYVDFQVASAEEDAARVARHLSTHLGFHSEEISPVALAGRLSRERENLVDSLELFKLKMFGPDGTALFSTNANDIGIVNKNNYFHEKVAKGEPFTKLVRKDQVSLEGQTIPLDVVETYVPIMRDGRFVAAFEIYYDVTRRMNRLKGLWTVSLGIQVLVGVGMFALLIRALLKTADSIRRHEEAERDRRLIAAVTNAAADAVMTTNSDFIIESVNPAFTRLTGYAPEDVLGQNPRILNSGRHGTAFFAGMYQDLSKKGIWRGDIWNRRKNGDIFAQRATIAAIHDDDGTITRYVAVFSDVTKEKMEAERIRALAELDPLTGLFNRTALGERLGLVMHDKRRPNAGFAVFFIDLDGFKPVNDRYGHPTGDKVLKEVSERLEQNVRENDIVARIGGDEFVVAGIGVSNLSTAEGFGRKLLNQFQEPFDIDGHAITVGCSVGIALYPEHGTSADMLLRKADLAMYQAKHAGKGTLRVYDPDTMSPSEISLGQGAPTFTAPHTCKTTPVSIPTEDNAPARSEGLEQGVE